MRRPRFRRTPSTRYSAPEYMMPIPQSPTRISLRNRDTGFPESFCGSRNTTLPHPEANLSPDACITEEDVNPARALLRYRMSFMAQQELHSRSSSFSHRTLSGSFEEGTLSALGRLAINSLRTGELPRLDGFLSSKEADSAESSDSSSRDPDSPLQIGREFDHPGPKVAPRDSVRVSREHRRRRSSFMSRLIHR